MIMPPSFISLNSNGQGLQQPLNRPMTQSQMSPQAQFQPMLQHGPPAHDNGTYSPLGRQQQQHPQGMHFPSPNQAPHPHPDIIPDELIRSVEEIDLTGHNWTEEDYAKRLSKYIVFQIVKIEPQDKYGPDGEETKSTWARCNRHHLLNIDQAEIRQEIEQLNRNDKKGKWRTLTKKQQSLGPNAFGQLKKAEDDLLAALRDQRFDIMLVQLDWTKKSLSQKHDKGRGRHSRSSRSHASKKSERTSITAYFKTCPRPDQSARELYRQLQLERRQLQDGMQRAQPYMGQAQAAHPLQQSRHQQGQPGAHQPQAPFQQMPRYQTHQPEVVHQQTNMQQPQPQSPRQQRPSVSIAPPAQGHQGGFHQARQMDNSHPHPSSSFTPNQAHKNNPAQGRQGGVHQGAPTGVPHPPPTPGLSPNQVNQNGPAQGHPTPPSGPLQGVPFQQKPPEATSGSHVPPPPPHLAESRRAQPDTPIVVLNGSNHNRRHSGSSHSSSSSESDSHSSFDSDGSSTTITVPSSPDTSSPQTPHKQSDFPKVSPGIAPFRVNETNSRVGQQVHSSNDRGGPKVYIVTGSDTELEYSPPRKYETASGINGFANVRGNSPASIRTGREDRRMVDRDLERERWHYQTRRQTRDRSPSRNRHERRDSLPQEQRKERAHPVPYPRLVPRSEVDRQRLRERNMRADLDRLNLGRH